MVRAVPPRLKWWSQSNENLNLPVAVDDSYTMVEDSVLTVDGSTDSQPSLLANDSDADGDPLTVIGVLSSPERGTLSFQSNGNFVYTPEANFFGQDSFVYQITDGKGATAHATALITVTGTNDAPDARDDSYTVEEGQTINMTVLDNDIDIDGDTIVITGAHGGDGTVEVLNGTSINYTAPTGFRGNDFIEYNISDGNGGTDFANVNITITGPNRAPVAVDDTATVNEDSSVIVNVLANDSDPDGDTLSVSSVNTANGNATVNSDNTVTFTPTANFNGTATVTYVVSDGLGGTDTGNVTVTVNPVNDAPVTVADSVSGPEDQELTISPLDNDTDVDGDSLTLGTVGVTVGQGEVVGFEGNSFRFQPAQDFNGEITISYFAEDGQASTSGTITVTITPVNDAPVAVADNASTDEDTSVVIDVSGQR